MAEVVLKANVPYVQNMPIEIRTGLVEVVGGYDDASNYVSDFVEEDTHVSGYALMRYLAKNYSDGKPNDTIYIHNNDNETGNTGAYTFIVTANTKKATLNTGGGNDTVQAFGGDGVVINGTKADEKLTVAKSSIKGSGTIAVVNGGAGNDTLAGSTGNDKLFGEASNDSINGGKGADTLSGGAGDDKILGGDGNDVFIYMEGKDTITDYADGDKISLSAEISKATVKGSNVVFTIGSGSLTVEDGKGKTISMIDADGKSYVTVVGGTTLNITNETNSPVTAGDGIKVINATKRTTEVQITGNDLTNTINGGSKNDTIYGEGGNDYLFGNKGNDKIYGGAGDDNIWGGAGNDSLWGNDGADTFTYMTGDGKDVIFGFDNDDLLQIMNDFTPSYTNGTITLKMDGGSITLKDFTATTFHINEETYQISGKKFVAK